MWNFHKKLTHAAIEKKIKLGLKSALPEIKSRNQ